jgi:hypothetical protein
MSEYKLTTQVIHRHTLGCYECKKCGSRNTGISGAAVDYVTVTHAVGPQTIELVYRGWCANDCKI